MAEIVGLIASIGAITSAGFKTARAISTIASDLGAVGAEISGIATDLKAISLILNELKKRLSKADNITVEVSNLVVETQLTKTALLDAKRLDTTFRFEEETSRTPSTQIEDGQAISENSEVDGTIALRSSMYNEEKMHLARPHPRTGSAILLETMSDDDFIKISEHLRLQKVVRELALKVVHHTSRQEPQAASLDDAAENYTNNWHGSHEAYPFLSSRAQLKEKLANTKKELIQSLERIELLDKLVETYKIESSTREENDRQSQEEICLSIRNEMEEELRRRMSDIHMVRKETKEEIEDARLAAGREAIRQFQAGRENLDHSS
ncbi:unnamed protein product [Fusarium langsethiae]|nr:unnamed protein product [Fusarium langsethiae]